MNTGRGFSKAISLANLSTILAVPPCSFSFFVEEVSEELSDPSDELLVELSEEWLALPEVDSELSLLPYLDFLVLVLVEWLLSLGWRWLLLELRSLSLD